MAAWVTLTESDVLNSMTVREREDFLKVSTAAEQPDRLPGILADLVAEIRGYIKSWSQNTLSADPNKIPDSMRGRALAVARWRALITMGSFDPNEARKAEWESAEKFFRQVAAGDIRPERADDAIVPDVPTKESYPVPKIKGRRRLFTRRTQDGI